jgi:hypothetical protein
MHCGKSYLLEIEQLYCAERMRESEDDQMPSRVQHNLGPKSNKKGHF